MPLLCLFEYSSHAVCNRAVGECQRSAKIWSRKCTISYCLPKERIDSEAPKRVVSNSSLTSVTYIRNAVTHLHNACLWFSLAAPHSKCGNKLINLCLKKSLENIKSLHTDLWWTTWEYEPIFHFNTSLLHHWGDRIKLDHGKVMQWNVNLLKTS